MSPVIPREEQALLDRALQAATDTRLLAIDRGVRHEAAGMFTSAFGEGAVFIAADERTFRAAGADVQASFRKAGIACDLFLFPDEVSAEHSFVELLQKAIGTSPAIPVAVGSGTINDLTKLVSHRL